MVLEVESISVKPIWGFSLPKTGAPFTWQDVPPCFPLKPEIILVRNIDDNFYLFFFNKNAQLSNIFDWSVFFHVLIPKKYALVKEMAWLKC